MSRDIDVHGYGDNTGGRSPTREPLVHMLGSRYGEVQSITFHPDDATRIAKAINTAARAAKRGRDRKITVALKSES